MEALKSLLLLVPVAVLVALGGLVAVGGADGHYEGEHLIQVEGRSAQIFELIAEPEKRKDWVSSASRSKWTTRSIRGVGSRIEEVVTIGEGEEKRELEVTVFEQDKRFGYKTTIDGATLELVYGVKPHYVGRRTLVKVVYQVQWEGNFNKLFEPILSNRISKAVESELLRLKQAADESSL